MHPACAAVVGPRLISDGYPNRYKQQSAYPSRALSWPASRRTLSLPLLTNPPASDGPRSRRGLGEALLLALIPPLPWDRVLSPPPSRSTRHSPGGRGSAKYDDVRNAHGQLRDALSRFNAAWPGQVVSGVVRRLPLLKEQKALDEIAVERLTGNEAVRVAQAALVAFERESGQAPG